MRNSAFRKAYIPAPKLNQLLILRQIESNQNVKQFELANRCDLSVAMINNYIKKLERQDLVACRRKSSKTLSYHLTNRGREALDTLRRELLMELADHFADAKQKIRELITDNANGNPRRVVLLGTGDLAELTFHALESTDVKIVGVCDEDPSGTRREWCGREILSPSQIHFLDPDLIVITGPGLTAKTSCSLSDIQNLGIRLLRLDDVGAGAGSPKPAGSLHTVEEASEPAGDLAAETHGESVHPESDIPGISVAYPRKLQGILP